MRDIKFRGKLINSKKWAYGNLDIKKTGTAIITPDETVLGRYGRINRETVGQYTGLKDKNGKEIYEGDIILTQLAKDKPFSKTAKSKRLRGVVKYNIKCGKNFIDNTEKVRYWGAEWDVEIIDKKDYEKYHNFAWGLFFECEIIGNIYDNPELLEEKR